MRTNPSLKTLHHVIDAIAPLSPTEKLQVLQRALSDSFFELGRANSQQPIESALSLCQQIKSRSGA